MIDRCDAVGMIMQERLPALGRRPPAPCHVLGDRSLADIDAELEQFAMDPGSAPERICQAHFSDQLANLEGNFWPAAATSRLPSPEQLETSTMPTDYGAWHYDCQGVHNPGRDPVEGGKDQAVEIGERDALR